MANINYKFMVDSVLYAGSTKKETKREADKVVRNLKHRVDQLTIDYSPKDLSEIYSLLISRTKSDRYKKTPIDTIEIKFFENNPVTGETVDLCHTLFSNEWYISHNPTSKIRAKYKNHIEDFSFFCMDKGISHIMFITRSLVLSYLEYYKKSGNFSTARDGKKVCDRKKSTIESTPATSTYNDRLKTMKYLMVILNETYPSIPVLKDVKHMKNDNSDGFKKEDFTDIEIAKIKAYIDSTEKHYDTTPVIIFIAGISTGLRLADLVYLEKSELHFKKDLGRWYIMTVLDKTRHNPNKEKVTIPVSSTFMEFVKDRLETNEKYLFPEVHRYYEKDGEDIKNNMSYRFKTFLKRCGIDTQAESKLRGHKICIRGIHSLRHTFARRLAEKDANVNLIKKMMGHKGVEMTMRYMTRLTDSQMEQMGNLMDEIDFLQ